MECDSLLSSLPVPPSFFLFHARRMPQNVNQVEKILVSSAKSNFAACLEGFRQVTAEKKKVRTPHTRACGALASPLSLHAI